MFARRYEGNKSRGEATKAFEFERANMEAGQLWAVANVKASHAAARLVIGYAITGVEMMSSVLAPSQLIGWLEGALVACHELNSRSEEANVLGNLGIAWISKVILVGRCRTLNGASKGLGRSGKRLS